VTPDPALERIALRRARNTRVKPSRVGCGRGGRRRLRAVEGNHEEATVVDHANGRARERRIHRGQEASGRCLFPLELGRGEVQVRRCRPPFTSASRRMTRVERAVLS